MDDKAALKTLTDRVAAEPRNAILTHKLKPDAPIRRAKLAQGLGIGRLPVREAQRGLESEGLVVIRPNSRARVVVWDHEACVEIYKVRERLEPLALSKQNPTQIQLVSITEFGQRPAEVPHSFHARRKQTGTFTSPPTQAPRLAF